MLYPVDIQVSWGKIALGEDLEPHFIKFEIKATVTNTDDFSGLKASCGSKWKHNGGSECLITLN